MTKKYMVKFLNEYPDWSSKPINQDFWAAFERYCRKQRKLESTQAKLARVN